MCPGSDSLCQKCKIPAPPEETSQYDRLCVLAYECNFSRVAQAAVHSGVNDCYVVDATRPFMRLKNVCLLRGRQLSFISAQTSCLGYRSRPPPRGGGGPALHEVPHGCHCNTSLQIYASRPPRHSIVLMPRAHSLSAFSLLQVIPATRHPNFTALLLCVE